MGYDVRYTQTRSFTDQEWGRMAMAVQKLAAAGKSRIGYLVHPVYSRSGDLVRRQGLMVEYSRIAFNGKRPAGCEDFEMFRKCAEFPHHACIKTNRHPYDLLVKATLLAVHRIAPDAVPEIGADGGPDAWRDAIELADRALGAGHGLPSEKEVLSMPFPLHQVSALSHVLSESPLRIEHPELDTALRYLRAAEAKAAAEPDAEDFDQECVLELPAETAPALAGLLEDYLERHRDQFSLHAAPFRIMLDWLNEEMGGSDVPAPGR